MRRSRGHLGLQGVRGTGRRRLPVQVIDQPLRADHLARIEEQPRQQRPHPRPADRERAAVLAPHLSRTQDPEPHCPIVAQDAPPPSGILVLMSVPQPNAAMRGPWVQHTGYPDI
jgi:hypothetical protein